MSSHFIRASTPAHPTLEDGPLPPAASRTMPTYDVLERVMPTLQRADLAACAQVSPLWSRPALDVLWRDLPSLLPLLNLLGELEFDSATGWRLISMPSPAALGRFYEYTSRVESLTHDDSKIWHKTPFILCPSSFLHVFAANPPRLPPSHCGLVLPGLRKLTWIARKPQTVGQILCLVSVSVKSLDLRVQGDAAVNEINDLFPELALRDLRGLEECLVTASSSNPILPLRPVFNQPSLRRLRLGAWFPFGSEVLLSLQNLPQLRALQIRPGLSPDVGTKELFSKLAGSCHLLEELVIGLASAEVGSRKAFDFSDIQPLLKLDKLIMLELHADLPLRLRSADVEAMAMAWQHIRSLSLCATVADPSASRTMVTPLGLLEAIAAAFPTSLKQLGLYFDCSQPLTNKKATKGFTSLRTLSVGNSTLVASKAKDVGKFIASLTPPGLRLIHSLPLAPDYPAFPDGLIANGSEAWLDSQRMVESSHQQEKHATRKILQGWVNKALGGLGKSS